MEIGILSWVIPASISAIGAYVAYLQYVHNKKQKPPIINVPPSAVPEIHIEFLTPREEANRKSKTEDENEPYQPLDDQFYVNFAADIEKNKRIGDKFTIEEK